MTVRKDSLPPNLPEWVRKAVPVAGGTGAALLACAWVLLLTGKLPSMPLALAGGAALCLLLAYALSARQPTSRLLGYGSKYVQVRSLDEWTLYQYGLPFDRSSPQQQSDALTHYRVGLRLFPVRPADKIFKRSRWQWLLVLLTFFSCVTLSQTTQGWYRFVTLVAVYAWLLGCMRLSRRFTDTPATSSLVELDLR